MAKYGGWAGRILRVDLSTGRFRTEDTVGKYKEVLGGTGIGYQVLWDEVPSGTKPLDHANKIVFATGPLAGTGAPCNGRTAVTTLWPTCWPKPLVASAHMGGHFAAELKYAGYDGIVIEGKADRPVWLSVSDNKVEIRDARHLWGKGIRRTTLEISQQIGPQVVVTAIGQAGENLVPMSVAVNSVSHSAGGIGAVMGFKNLKAIAVRGTGSVRIAGDKEEWEKLIKYNLTLIGANNQHVVPRYPQPWAEYYSAGSRWLASRGRKWGAAGPPIDTGACDPHDLNHIAYRTNSAVHFLGDLAWKYTVRGNGCTSCPIRCHTLLRVPSLAVKYGIKEEGQSTCVALTLGKRLFRTFPDGPTGQTSIEAAMIGIHLTNDLGIWCNYGQMIRDLDRLYYGGVLKDKLGGNEYKSYSWDKYEKGDPTFLFELLPKIAAKEGELATVLGLGTGYMFDRWTLSEEEWMRDHRLLYWKMGHPKHHANEDAGQCGAIINTQYNRDSQNHSHSNFTRSGLPLCVQKRLAGEIWGSEDAIDAVGDYTRMNTYKARKTRWSLLRKELLDSLGLCSWMAPWIVSPLKERGYRGDNSMESKLYSLATGDSKSREELDAVAERIFVLHRALTIRDMGTKQMRKEHDTMPEWLFHDPAGRAAFTKGVIRMDRSDMATAMDMYYEEMGWDRATGAPTAGAYRRLGLGKVSDFLSRKELLP